MISVRVFTDKGVKEFRTFLSDLKNTPARRPPELNEKPYSSKLKSELELLDDIVVDENKMFNNRMEMGRYLTEKFRNAGLDRSELIGMANLWTWFSSLWHDQLCPKKGNSRFIGRKERHICSTSWKRYYKHLVASSYYMYSLLGGEYSKLFLERPPHEYGEVTEAVMGRQYIISTKELVKAIHRLFWDENKGKPKTGYASKHRPGTARRLGKIVNQLRLTYDLRGMKADDILSVFPSEFNRWKK